MRQLVQRRIIHLENYTLTVNMNMEQNPQKITSKRFRNIPRVTSQLEQFETKSNYGVGNFLLEERCSLN